MHTALRCLLLSGLAALAFQASAAEHMKPGLWEMTTKSDVMKDMPKIPPEQLEKMKSMGIKMPQMLENGMVTKMCITKEQAAQDHPPVERNESGCTTKNVQRGSNSFSADVVCDGPKLKGSGTTKGTFSKEGTFVATHDFKGVADGKPVSHHTETSGRWLSADCGDVPPMGSHMGGRMGGPAGGPMGNPMDNRMPKR